eukprot:9810561-Alexandrium_andersonii.AAC.1
MRAMFNERPICRVRHSTVEMTKRRFEWAPRWARCVGKGPRSDAPLQRGARSYSRPACGEERATAEHTQRCLVFAREP